jgi:energy-coupling factor transporter ATP-binding protein EcfA2
MSMVYFKRWPHWWGLKEDSYLSIIDVVNSGAIDFKLAGLLWLLMEHRASVLVAAGPSFAGKSTLLHALLDFLPPEIEQITLRGYGEDFKLTGVGKPDKTYLVTEEISNHSYEYLWGHQVVRALELIPKGYALGGTIHARNIKEVAYVLHALGAPASLIARIGLVITLQVTFRRSYDDPVRYVDTVSTVNLTQQGLVAQLLATRQSVDDKFIYLTEQTLHNALFNKFTIKYDDIASEIELRGRFLSELRDKGICSREEVKRAIPIYYRS